MDSVISEYMAFLRWCLNTNEEMPSCVSQIDWHNLLSFAKKQTIVGIYWQGIKRLNNDIDNKPTEDDVMEWMGEATKITRRNKQINEGVAILTKFMQENNASFFIFKGQTVAQFYPNPEFRTSGDIDFYANKEDRNRIKSLIEQKLTLTNCQSGQHWEFTISDVPYELHYHLALFASPNKQKYWDNLIDSYFDEVLEHVNIDGVSVPTLPSTLNSIYLFIHIYRHFLKEGIALRQFIDWMMFFESKHDEIVVSELTAKLERLGLLRAFKAFGAVLVDVLGMDAKYFPLPLTNSDRRYEHKIMFIVLKYGNFGKYGRKEQQSGWRHSIETGFRSIRHLTQFFWLSPSENMLWLPKLVKHSIIKNSSK